MRNASIVAAALAAIVVAAAGSADSACYGTLCPVLPDSPYVDNGTSFDLGISVMNVPLTSQGVGRFMAGLSPRDQQILHTACYHYLANPVSARSKTTLDFCAVLVE